MRCGKKQCYLESLWTFRYNKDIASEKTLKSGEKKGVTMDIIAKISEELGIRKNQAEAAVKLIDEGNTIPFIARYRKEATGALNDEVLRNLYERREFDTLKSKKVPQSLEIGLFFCQIFIFII